MNKRYVKIIFLILSIVLTSCSFHPYDLPFIGWRLEIAAQRKHYEQREKEIESEQQLEEIRNLADG